jgi:hypothetical protein
MKRREQTKQLKHATEMKRPGPPDIAAEIVAWGGGGGGRGNFVSIVTIVLLHFEVTLRASFSSDKSSVFLKLNGHTANVFYLLNSNVQYNWD